ncbi:hypothetical protein Q5X43_02675 [Acinetobacter baumannii]|nr:hypothetical protein [Acinetobacter baumannii]
MAVPEQTPFIEYTANGTTTIFPLTFDCDNSDFLIVKLNDDVATTGSWALTDKSVKFVVAPENGVKVSIQRDTPLERTTDYQLYNNSLQPSAINKDFDAIWRKLQELGYTDSVLLRMIIQEISDRKEVDAFLLAKLAAEELARINADAYLQSQISTSSLDISKLQQKLAKEIIDRIEGDRDAKQYAKDYTDFMITQVDENMPIFDGVSDRVVIAFNGDTQLELNKDGKRGSINSYDPAFATKYGYNIGHSVRLSDGSEVVSQIDNNPNDPNSNLSGWAYVSVPSNKDYPPVLSERSIRFQLKYLAACLRYGLNDPLPLDNNTNMFRGLTNKDAWADENLGVGSVSFGRNGCSKAYLTTTFGHDCITYGVASLAGGAGSGTGNPDVPTDGANYGYCAFVHGKDTLAQGARSAAFGTENVAGTINSFAHGFQSETGKGLSTHPNGVASEGDCAFAFGYRAYAYGDYSVSLGSFIISYNSGMAIGRGINPGSKLISNDALVLGYGVDVPTIALKKGNGTNGGFGKLGINTAAPLERVEIRTSPGDKIAIRSDKGVGGVFDLQSTTFSEVTLKESPASIFRIEYTSPNTGSAHGVTTLYQNGNKFMTMNESGDPTFNRILNSIYGYQVGGTRVIGGQMPAIADLPSNATLSDVITKLNTLLASLRQGTGHGLIAP